MKLFHIALMMLLTDVYLTKIGLIFKNGTIIDTLSNSETYDEKCCKDHGMTPECMVLCRDERFRKGLLRQGPRPPRPCDKFESISDKCVIPIPPKGTR